jgi:hypothetical protein
MVDPWGSVFCPLRQPCADGVEIARQDDLAVGIGQGEGVAQLSECQPQPLGPPACVARSVYPRGYLRIGRRPSSPHLRSLTGPVARKAFPVLSTIAAAAPEVVRVFGFQRGLVPVLSSACPAVVGNEGA